MSADDRKTPLHDEHVALGATMVPFAGWLMPVQYEGLVKEHHAVRQRAGLFDVSHMGELDIKGDDAIAFVDSLVTGSVASLPTGKALYTLACNEGGTILDDLIVYRRGGHHVLVVCNASNREKIASHFAAHSKRWDVRFEDQSDNTGLIALQGPKAEAILREAGVGEVAELGAFELLEAHLAGAHVLIARTGYTGEDGFEIFCPWDATVGIWKQLMRVGGAWGIAPAGLGARDTLRLESRMSLYGNEIDETTQPLEAGLGWVVNLDKPDFLGKAAIAAFKANGYPRRLVAFEMTGRGIARHGHTIHNKNGELLGPVTSGSPSPTLGIHIGLGYVPAEYAKLGTEFDIDIRGKRVAAVVRKAPFYKRTTVPAG